MNIESSCKECPLGAQKMVPMKVGRFWLGVNVPYNVYTNSFRVGIVIQDSNGKPCATFAKLVARSSSVIGVELIAILYDMGLVAGRIGSVRAYSILDVRLLHELFNNS